MTQSPETNAETPTRWRTRRRRAGRKAAHPGECLAEQVVGVGNEGAVEDGRRRQQHGLGRIGTVEGIPEVVCGGPGLDEESGRGVVAGGVVDGHADADPRPGNTVACRASSAGVESHPRGRAQLAWLR